MTGEDRDGGAEGRRGPEGAPAKVRGGWKLGSLGFGFVWPVTGVGWPVTDVGCRPTDARVNRPPREPLWKLVLLVGGGFWVRGF